MRASEGPPTQPTMRRPPAQPRRDLRTLLLGMVLGMFLTLLVGGVAFGLGYLPIIEVQSPVAVCPPTPVFYPVCPTCGPTFAAGLTTPGTPTETPTATLDISATATAACATYQGLFPGTPCP